MLRCVAERRITAAAAVARLEQREQFNSLHSRRSGNESSIAGCVMLVVVGFERCGPLVVVSMERQERLSRTQQGYQGFARARTESCFFIAIFGPS